MKVAVVTHNGEVVGHHFGRARYYKIFTIQDGQIVQEELVEKPSVHGHHSQEEHHHGEGHTHGPGPHASWRHAAMIEPIKDCDVLIAGAMGQGAYQHLQQAGLRVMITGHKYVKDAIKDFLQGTLRDEADSLLH